MNFPSKTSTRGDAALLAEEVDRLLDEHLSHPAEQLAPSSGFVHSVMESVSRSGQRASASRLPLALHSFRHSRHCLRSGRVRRFRRSWRGKS